jgi:hypothetical protein
VAALPTRQLQAVGRGSHSGNNCTAPIVPPDSPCLTRHRPEYKAGSDHRHLEVFSPVIRASEILVFGASSQLSGTLRHRQESTQRVPHHARSHLAPSYSHRTRLDVLRVIICRCTRALLLETVRQLAYEAQEGAVPHVTNATARRTLIHARHQCPTYEVRQICYRD